MFIYLFIYCWLLVIYCYLVSLALLLLLSVKYDILEKHRASNNAITNMRDY